MRLKISLLILLLVGLLTACSPPSSSEQTADEVEDVDSAVPVDAADSTSGESVLPVAGKPQLLEFYADW